MNKTPDGLRDRLFETLDALIKKEISSKEVESVCYLSEQIIKTGQLELDFLRAKEEMIRSEREYNLELKREEQKALSMLSETIEAVTDE